MLEPQLGMGHDDGVGALGNGMLRDVREAGVGVHVGQIAERVGVAGNGCGQHGHGEGGRLGRRDAIFVGDEFQGGDSAAGFQRMVNFFEERDAGVLIEVMQEIGKKDDVIGTGEFDLESTAREHVVTVLDTGYLCILDSYM